VIESFRMATSFNEFMLRSELIAHRNICFDRNGIAPVFRRMAYNIEAAGAGLGQKLQFRKSASNFNSDTLLATVGSRGVR
jgi:hypothetical protein